MLNSLGAADAGGHVSSLPKTASQNMPYGLCAVNVKSLLILPSQAEYSAD